MLRIDNFKLPALEKICEYTPFEIALFEKDGYCNICARDCYYAKQILRTETIQCTKKGNSFLDEDLRYKSIMPEVV